MMKLELPEGFFEPEVRDGFYISRMMKKLWASEMKVLSEISRVCEENGLCWFLDNGSLLGAVRHGGFVPWDDDFDICMMRSDYEKFLAIARDALPAAYQITNIHTDPQCLDFTTRITNSNVIRTDKEYMDANFGFPYIAGVDIFPLDKLSENEKEEDDRIEKICHIEELAQRLLEDQESEATWRLFDLVERENNYRIVNGNISQQLNFLIEKWYRRFEDRETERVGLLHYWSSGKSHAYQKKWFDIVLTMDFEGMRLNVPAQYEEVLRVEYGDFMRPVRGTSLHDYPMYALQEKALTEHIHARPFFFPFRETAAKVGFRMPEGKPQELVLTDPFNGWETADGNNYELILEPALQPDAKQHDDLLEKAIEEQVLSIGSLFSHRIRLKDEKLKDVWLKLLKAEVPEIPWEQKIEVRAEEPEEPPAPASEKVILYGTGFSSLLQYREKAIGKQEWAFSLMKKRKDLKILWITPLFLPREEENIKILREREPELMAGYESFAAGYREYAVSDPESAVQQCTAYYGDPGLWAGRCHAAGKVVMIQNINILNISEE